MTKKKVIKRVKWKVVGKIFFLLFCIGLIYVYFANLNMKNIIIKGNEYVSDNEIIMLAGIKDYPKLFQISSLKMNENILKNDYIDSVKIHKSITGTLTIEISEASSLFYNRNHNRLVLSNHKEIQSENLNGVPILVNYVPDSFNTRLIDELAGIHKDVLTLISEIEYQPWKSNDVVIDDTRFFLRMNDGNTVYVNLLHMEKLNNYIEIYATLEGKHGILYLDSASDKISFGEYKVGEQK